MKNEDKKEISKIKLPDSEIYNLKDEEFRRQLDILLGRIPPENAEESKDVNNDNK